MGCPDGSLTREYQDDLRRGCLIKAVAGHMEERGMLSPAERREFLTMEAEKHSLILSVLTR